MRDNSTQGQGAAAGAAIGGVVDERVEGVEFIETVLAEPDPTETCELPYELVAAMIAEEFLPGPSPLAGLAAWAQLS